MLNKLPCFIAVKQLQQNTHLTLKKIILPEHYYILGQYKQL